MNEGLNEGGIKAFCCDLRRVHWPLNFKPTEIN
jgi:hypothetical protein